MSQGTNKRKPIVSMISNCIDENNRNIIKQRNGYLTTGVYNPYWFAYKNHDGIILPLDFTPDEIFCTSGMKRAKDYFLNAVNYSILQGVKVILLAASTKRIFGDGKELKSLYPDILFTIGDNGTALAILKQIEYVTKNLDKDSPIIVLGAGFLGETAITFLKENGFNNIIVISRHKVNSLDLKYCYQSLDEYIGSTDYEGASLLVACAHNHCIRTEQLNALINDKLIILDVAVPKAVPYSIISSLNEKVARFDGGDFEIMNLKFNFPYQLTGFNFEGEFYGCFTEALLLALNNHKGNNDFFKVTKDNINIIRSLIENNKNDFVISMKNFGKIVPEYEDILKF
jgi:hypothetical protein